MADEPIIIDGIDISRKYTIEEIMSLYYRGRLRPVAVEGYIVRADADGMVGFVKAEESTLFRMERGKTLVHQSDDFVDAMAKDVEENHPMRRRGGQEKRYSLVKRLLRDAQTFGTIPGLTDAQVSAMIGEKWVTGVSQVTQEMLDRVSIHYLGQGENANKAADAKRITRKHVNA